MSTTIRPAPGGVAASLPRGLPSRESLRLRSWHWLLTPGWVCHTPAARLRGWARVLAWSEAASPASRLALVAGAVKTPGRVWRDAGADVRQWGAAMEAVSGWSPARQRRALAWIALRTGLGERAFRDNQLWRPERRRRAAEFLQDRECRAVLRWVLRRQQALYGDSDYARLDSKQQFPGWCAEHGLPTVPVLLQFADGMLDSTGLPPHAVNDPGAILPPRDLFAKPDFGSRGASVARYIHITDDEGQSGWRDGEGRIHTADQLLATLAAQSAPAAAPPRRVSNRVLLQPALRNHPAMEPLTTGALSTVRVVLSRPPGGPPRAVRATCRLPVGAAPVDNFSAGGIAAAVDLDTGRLGAGIRRLDLIIHPVERHPDTGALIEGVQLPWWPETLALATRAFDAARRIPIIGWDIAITDDGPILIEGNTASDPGIAQSALGRPLSETSLPDDLGAHVRELLLAPSPPESR